MKSNTSSRSGLFLMELIISILFFSLAGAVCVILFVNSHIISKDSVELNHSLEWCQNVAEVFYGCNGNIEEMTDLFDNLICVDGEDSGSFLLLFDENYRPLSIKEVDTALENIDYSYVVSVNISIENQMLLCHIYAAEYSKEDYIYELTVSLYPKGGSL